MIKSRMWSERELVEDGLKFHPLVDSISIEELMRLRALQIIDVNGAGRAEKTLSTIFIRHGVVAC